MTQEHVIEHSSIESFMLGVGAPRFSLATPHNRDPRWVASCYWPNGDVVRDHGCHGLGDTAESAIADMWAKVEKAKLESTVLKTAAECKAAVIALIQQHEAAPASFRDAVDALPVKQ